MKKLWLAVGFVSLNVYAVDDSIELLQRYKSRLSDEPYTAAKTINRDIKIGQKNRACELSV